MSMSIEEQHRRNVEQRAQMRGTLTAGQRAIRAMLREDDDE